MALLRKLTQARILCANTFHDLNTLDTLANEWDVTAEETSPIARISLHLSCEAGANECHTILDILTGFITNGEAPEWLWLEITLRRESTLELVQKIAQLIDHLAQVRDNPELGLKEMKVRADVITAKVESMNSLLEELRAEVERQQQIHGTTNGTS